MANFFFSNILNYFSAMVFPATMLLTMLSKAVAQDANCDYYQYVQPDTNYYVYSPRYSNNYTAGVQCRWSAQCPEGYNLKLQCDDVLLPSSAGCSGDQLLISRTGDAQLAGADRYCGKGKISTTSTKQALTIGLISTWNSMGGRFLCTLTAVPAAQPACTCGYRKVNRIVGGEETGINEYPMMAAIVQVDTATISCGAVIIDKQYVMTAAHCLDKVNISNYVVVVGEHNTDTNDSPATKGYLIIKKIAHPNYNPSTYDYDICLAQVSPEILFSERVGPACLPIKYINKNFTGSQVTLLGWGTTSTGAPRSKVLRKVNVDIISENTCKKALPAVTSRQFCTYTPGKDACQGDSGGPALYMGDDNGLLYSLGIISNGRFCAGKGDPGEHTSVPAFISWIRQSTGGSVNFCNK